MLNPSVSVTGNRIGEAGWRALEAVRRMGAPGNRSVWKTIHAVVFQSDDWGWCGLGRDRLAVDELFSLGYDLSDKEYSNTLESADDLGKLFAQLSASQDAFGKRAVFTPNFILANPDYNAIRSSNYTKYVSLPVSTGFPSAWRARGDVKGLWLDGLRRRVWRPEYHGLSHFDVVGWLGLLRIGNKMARDFFDREMIPFSKTIPLLGEYGIAKTRKFLDLDSQRANIKTGCNIFEGVFGYSPSSAISPNWLYNSDTIAALAEQGIHYLQDRLYPPSFSTPAMLARRGIVRLGRNIDLEPRGTPTIAVRRAIEKTASVFKSALPAVVNTHRINYVSGVDAAMSRIGLRQLSEYLRYLGEDEKLAFLTSDEAFQLDSKGYSILKWEGEFIIRNYRRDGMILSVGHPKGRKVEIGPNRTVTIGVD